MTDLSIHGYCGLYPVTRAERTQAEAEAAMEREDRDDPDGAYRSLAEGTGPKAAVDAEEGEEDAVTWLDKWRWSLEVETNRKEIFHMTREQRERMYLDSRRHVERKVNDARGDQRQGSKASTVPVVRHARNREIDLGGIGTQAVLPADGGRT